MKFQPAIFLILIASLLACKPKSPEEIRKELRESLINAKKGDVIRIPAGRIEMDASLTLDGVDNITIKGEGIEKTILSFQNQKQGAEGIKVKSNHFVIEGLTVVDTQGDGIKVIESEDVTIRNIKVEWTKGPDTSNGGYGLYPVKCKNVLIEHCFISGASDAGIYVGQSADCVIRNNECTNNVQGIESENSSDVLIYGNKAYGNTSGISVNNLPDLPLKNGRGIKVYDNVIKENNLPNFGAPGSTVYIIPAGTGLFILSGDQVEVYKNRLENHRTTGLAVISYPITGRPMNDSLYYPFTKAVNVHDNVFVSHPGHVPDTTRELGRMMAMLFQTHPPEIVFDGLWDPQMTGNTGAIPPDKRICIRNNSNAVIANLDAGNEFKHVSMDEQLYDCALDIKVKTTHP